MNIINNQSLTLVTNQQLHTMKTKLLFLIIGLCLFVSGCKKEPVVLPDALVTSKAQLTMKFASLNEKMSEAVTYMGSVNMDSTLIRTKLTSLVNDFTDMEEFAQISPAGIMQNIEPSLYYSSQGANISTQSHVIKAFETKLPVLSLQFPAVEGFFAAVVIHPIVKNSAILGGLTALFLPEKILGDIMKPINNGQTFELWVMEKGGRLIYDQDASEIGHNLLTDAQYKDFPELVAAAEKINSEESGTTTYSYYKAGTTQTVKKLTYWTTFEMYGTQWKLVYGKPE